MGALTNEIKAFTYRVWENDLSVEIDDTEIAKYRIRLEKAKIKRVRYLPIHYWISNGKRFKKERPLWLVNLIKIINRKQIRVKTKVREQKKSHIIMRTAEIYIMLLKKLIYDREFTCFAANKIKVNDSNIDIYNDLLLSSFKKVRNEKKLINKEDIDTNVVLLTNTRLESPDLNAYLHINAETFTFTSVSFFVSSFSKNEIPFSSFNLINAFGNCFYPLFNTTIITSLFTSSFKSFINVLYLAPLFVNPILYYSKHLKHSYFSLFSYKNFDLFSTPLISNNVLLSPYVTLPFNSTSFFDNFVLKKISHKFFYRLLFLLTISAIKRRKIKTNDKVVNFYSVPKIDVLNLL